MPLPWAALYPPEPLTAPLRGVGLRADGALTNTVYAKSSSLIVLPLYDRLYYCSCALASWFQWFFHNTLNPFPAHCSEWLVPCPHIKLCYIFLQQTALYCITSWYLPSAGPISLTSQTLLNKRRISSEFVLPPMPVFSMDLKPIIISWGILQIDPSRCQGILQNVSVAVYLQDLASPMQTGKTSSYCSLFSALL